MKSRDLSFILQNFDTLPSCAIVPKKVRSILNGESQRSTRRREAAARIRDQCAKQRAPPQRTLHPNSGVSVFFECQNALIQTHASENGG